MTVDREWLLEPNDDDLCDEMWGCDEDEPEEEESEEEEEEASEEEKSINQMKRSKSNEH